MEIKPEDFQEARKILKGKALVTPLIPMIPVTTSNPIYLKAEGLQPVGSFKMRGATYAISKLPKAVKTIIAYSTGNHAQAVALSATQMGLKSIIVMSPDVPESKIAATKRFGAEVILVSPQERQSYAENLAKEEGTYLIPPYDHRDVVIGQGTIGLEILDELDPAAVFVPVGGGGLIAGIATAIKQKNPNVKVIGVEPELEDDGCRSYRSGIIVRQPGPSSSVADAVKVPSLGNIPFPLIRANVDDMITVNEQQIIDATFMIADSARIISEPAGALGLAGALIYKGKFPENKPIVCVVSGGNAKMSSLCSLV